jgi:hypothetical protein
MNSRFIKNLVAFIACAFIVFTFNQCKKLKDLPNGVLLDEDFSDNSEEWMVEKDSAKEFKIANGYLTLKTFDGNWYAQNTVTLDTLKDFNIETVIKHVSVKDTLTYGLRIEDALNEIDNKVYYFLINENNELIICSSSSEDPDYKHYLQPGSVTVKPDTAGDTFTIERTGKNTTFFFNKQKITTLKDTPFIGTSVGFALFNSGTIEVDYLKVIQK